ncbi:MAG TPA: hypothetical protein VGT60_00345 [Candidatus Limnocylindria bacterium]|nr:hypothetical protein [Candidatus Limnocylindria bacterium]
MAGVRIHQANDQASAEVMAGRLRAEGVAVQVIRADTGAPYDGMGASAAFDLLVPEALAAQARAILAGGEGRKRRR